MTELSSVMKSCFMIAKLRAINSRIYPDVCYDAFAEFIDDTIDDQSIETEIFLHNRDVPRKRVGFSIRMLSIDNQINKILHTHPHIKQVVSLGCGMDSRSFRLQSLSKSTLYEVDYEQVLEAKDNLIKLFTQSCGQPCVSYVTHRVSVSADINQANWIDSLVQHGFDTAQDTIWIIEGLLMYMTEEKTQQILHTIHTSCGLNSFIIGSHANQEMVKFAQQSGTQLGQSWLSFFPNLQNVQDVYQVYNGWSCSYITSIGSSDNELFGLPISIQNPSCFMDDGSWNERDKLALVFVLNKILQNDNTIKKNIFFNIFIIIYVVIEMIYNSLRHLINSTSVVSV